MLPSDNEPIDIAEGKILSTLYYPVNFYAVESAAQSIFYANEIGIDKGAINSVVFQSDITSDFISEPFSIFIAETDKTVFDEQGLVDPALFTKVFEGAVFFPGKVKDVVIPFDTPYDYKGGNIIIMSQKLGKEFILGENFKARESKNINRSISAYTYTPSTLVEGGYAKPVLSDCYPEIRFNMVKAPNGTISGNVKQNGSPIEGARVSVANTQLHTMTDKDGNFSFSQVAAGSVALTVEKHGYPVLTTKSADVKAGENTAYDIELVPFGRHTVSGTVTSASGKYPVDGVRIALKVYDDMVTWTDSKGKFKFENVASSTGVPSVLNITNDFYENKKVEIEDNGNIIQNIELADKPLSVHDVKTTFDGINANISWTNTKAEFAHDHGDPADYIGWSHGTPSTTLSSAFHKKARITHVSWFVSGKFTHSNFSVFIFGLNENGAPDAKKILYHVEGINAVNDDWTIHKLPYPIEADGFAVGIGCDGFMGLGITEPTLEYPFEDGQCFMAGDGYDLTQSPLSIFGEYHNMIRAYGENLGDSQSDNEGCVTATVRPEPKYKVYRLCKGEWEDEWSA